MVLLGVHASPIQPYKECCPTIVRLDWMHNVLLQAFVQYKAAAASSLTDWAFVKAQSPRPLPTSGVLRQFEELFQQHDLVLMGHSVDLSSAVASHIQCLLHSNAQYLVALCEVRPGHVLRTHYLPNFTTGHVV